MRRLGLAMLLALAAVPSPVRATAAPAPEWQGLSWIQGGPLTLAGLRGKLVLVRFWAIECSFCRQALPVLQGLAERYKDRGFVVIGIHHPKGPGHNDRARIEKAIADLGVTFPVATDPEWKTVRAYGVGTRFKAFTSVSVLIDREGRIVWTHEGGTLGPEDQAALAGLVGSL